MPWAFLPWTRREKESIARHLSVFDDALDEENATRGGFLQKSLRNIRIEKLSARDSALPRVSLDLLWFALRNLSRAVAEEARGALTRPGRRLLRPTRFPVEPSFNWSIGFVTYVDFCAPSTHSGPTSDRHTRESRRCRGIRR